MVLMWRNGYLEEGYFSYKFIPLVGPQGYVVGSWATAWETTRERINDRRSRLLHSFNDQIAAAVDLNSLWENVIRGLESFDKDIPIAMIYVDSALRKMDSSIPNETTTTSGQTYHLEGQVGISAGHPFALPILETSETDHTRSSGSILDSKTNHLLITAFREAQSSHAPVVLTLPEGVLEGTDFRGFGAPSSEVAIFPLITGAEVNAFAVFGLNPRKRYDSDYEGFLRRLADQRITNKLSAVLLSIEKERSELQAHEAALDRRRHERARQEEMKFSKFAERVQVGLCVTDLLGNVLYANRPWYEFSGFIPEAMGAISWMDAVLEEDRCKLEEAWEKITVDSIPWTFEFRTKIAFTGSARNPHMRADHRTGLCAAYPDFADDGKTVVSVMGIIVDISETKHNEKVTTEKMEEAIFLRKRQEIFIDVSPIFILLIASVPLCHIMRLNRGTGFLINLSRLSSMYTWLRRQRILSAFFLKLLENLYTRCQLDNSNPYSAVPGF
jgi:PAS domain S-box-containing protein